MGKHIVRWSYWLGTAFALLAVVARLLNLAGIDPNLLPSRGNPIGYHTFLDAALLFFLISIATAEYRALLSTDRPL